MSPVTKVVLGLLIAFLLSLLTLAAHLLHVFCRSRHLLTIAEPELGASTAAGANPSTSPSLKKLLQHLLRWKMHSRIEPASEFLSICTPAAVPAKNSLPPSVAVEEEGYSSEWWRAMAFGPSRVLCTIMEEDFEGLESDVENAAGIVAGGPENAGRIWADWRIEDEEVLFWTASDSSPFYTPASSPNRGAEKLGNASAGDVSPASEWFLETGF